MEKRMKKSGDSPGRAPLWSRLLQPIGLLYLGIGRIRAALLSYREALDLGRPTVSVGNLTFGGTGKTPVTVELARMLIGKGLRPAVILRGYRRETRGALLVKPSSSWREVGDEALVIAQNLPGVPVAVAEKREEAARLVVEEADVLLLDDGFQHMRVKRDLDLLLVDATRPGHLHAPPVGQLRESLRSASRADAVFVTRGSASELPEALLPFVEGRPIIGVSFEWGEAVETGLAGPPWSELAGKRAMAFAGVGNPSAFFSQAAGKGLQIVAERALKDHAEPDTSTLKALIAEGSAANADFFLTTEKDAVKWLPLWPGEFPLVYPKLRARFDDPDGVLHLLPASLAGGN